jgi:hypothetical protein
MQRAQGDSEFGVRIKTTFQRLVEKYIVALQNVGIRRNCIEFQVGGFV